MISFTTMIFTICHLCKVAPVKVKVKRSKPEPSPRGIVAGMGSSPRPLPALSGATSPPKPPPGTTRVAPVSVYAQCNTAVRTCCVVLPPCSLCPALQYNLMCVMC